MGIRGCLLSTNPISPLAIKDSISNPSSLFIGPKSDYCLALSLSKSLTLLNFAQNLFVVR